jgi:hypothetical protein
MASPSLEVMDMSRMGSLVMPAPRAHRPATASLLKPIEMAAKSIHFHSGTANAAASGIAPPASVTLSILASPAEQPPPAPPLVLQGWAVPVGYAVCGLGMGLCNLIAPAHIRDCANLLSPVWTLALGMHAATQAGSDGAWLWWGVLTIVLLPFVILVRDPLFVSFYLVNFAGFALGRFWVHTQGAQFLLACACCVGVVAGCSAGLMVDQPQAQLSVAAFFAISAGVIGSVRPGKSVIRVG